MQTGVENLFSEDSFQFFLSWVVRIGTFSSKLDHQFRGGEKPHYRENDNYSPYIEIVQTAIKSFQEKFPKKKVSYNKLDGFTNIAAFTSLLSEKLTEEDLSAFPYSQEFKAKFVGKSVFEGIVIIINHFSGLGKIKNELNNASSFFELIFGRSSRLPGDLIGLLKNFSLLKLKRPVVNKIDSAYSYVNPELNRVGLKTVDDENKEVYEQLISLYEKKYLESGSPQSASIAIVFLLEKYDGDLNKTFNALANFFKFVTRDESRVKGAGKWMQTHVLDEFSPHMPYSDLPEQNDGKRGVLSLIEHYVRRAFGINVTDDFNFWADASLINQIGKVYHAAYLTSMLEAVDARFLSLLTAAEYSIFGAGHGPNKAVADALVLQNLLSLEKYLDGFIE